MEIENVINCFWSKETTHNGKVLHNLRLDGHPVDRVIVGAVDQVDDTFYTHTLHLENCPNLKRFRTLTGAKKYVENETMRILKLIKGNLK